MTFSGAMESLVCIFNTCYIDFVLATDQHINYLHQALLPSPPPPPLHVRILQLHFILNICLFYYEIITYALVIFFSAAAPVAAAPKPTVAPALAPVVVLATPPPAAPGMHTLIHSDLQ